jgi:hypothetical protein
MDDLSRWLFLAGAVPYLVLGTAHALATPLATTDRKGLSPYDPQLGEAMAHTTVRLTRRTDMWRAWVGFNFSHSLGVVLLGLVVVLVGRNAASFETQAPVFVPLAAIAAAVYLALALRYWFRTPAIGCALSLASFLSAWLVRLVPAWQG